MPRENMLAISTTVEKDLGCLLFTGELVAESRFDTERILREWYDGGLKCVIVNCSGLHYIDSAGFSTLLAALHRFRRVGGDLILTELNPSLNAIFELTAMEKYFKVFATQAEAHEHFEQLSAQRRKQSKRSAGAKESPKPAKKQAKGVGRNRA